MDGPCRAGAARTGVMSDNMDHVIVIPWSIISTARPRDGRGGALSGQLVDVAGGHVRRGTVRWVETVDSYLHSYADYICQSRKKEEEIFLFFFFFHCGVRSVVKLIDHIYLYLGS